MPMVRAEGAQRMAETGLTPLGAVAKGVVAGAVGTLAMDLVWYRRYRRGGGEQSFTDWEFASGTEGYEEASAPAQVGKRLVGGLLQRELPPETALPMTNVVHWGTGLAWGAIHGIVAGSARSYRPVLGPLTGLAAWAAGYAVLGPAGIYRPFWEYDSATLGKDLGAHLVFGLVAGAAFGALTARRRG